MRTQKKLRAKRSRGTAVRSSSASFKRIDGAVPADLDLHLIVDNHATHKHAKVRLWLAQRPRFQMHNMPTFSPWLNRLNAGSG